MAFEITKSVIYQLIGTMGCGCKKVHEYTDSAYTQSSGDEGLYSGCAKHAGKESGETISTILTEFIETEAKREAAKPTARQVAPGTEVDEHGNVINRIDVPNKIRPLHRRPQLSNAALPPQMPEVVEPGESGDAMDALLASEDSTEHPTTVIRPR